jgi:hypothetical protein
MPNTVALEHVELKRLYTLDEIMPVRQTASELRGAYNPPSSQEPHATV